jgi:phosphoribosylglycinamide formyltransferase 1
MRRQRSPRFPARRSSVGSNRVSARNRASSFIPDVQTLCNLVVDLSTISGDARPIEAEVAEDRTLAWIDETFSGTWGSEAAAGVNIVARRADAPIGFATLDARGLKYRWLNGLARERDVGLFGPFGVVAEERKTGLGVFILRQALQALRERGYARALIPAVSGEGLLRYYADSVGAIVAEEFDRAALLAPRPRTLVMASGNGSNFQAVADASHDGSLPIEIVALVSNDVRAHAIERARAAGVAGVHVVEWRRKEELRAQYDERLLETVRFEKPNLVLLLGWMHLLSDAFVSAFPEMLNLHPAFLPLDPGCDDVALPDGARIAAFRGPRAVRDALAAGSRWVGATVHRVTPATDRGPVLARKPLRVEAAEEEASLMERLHAAEHRLVKAAITRWLFERPA